MGQHRQASPRPTIRLFVYGTLMPGYYYHPRIAPHVRRWRRGWIDGVLVDVGWYPALVPGRGIVQGVLLEVDEAGLAVTDYIEAYRPGDHASEYIRKQVQVRLDEVGSPGEGPTVSAWTYEFARPEHLADRPVLLAGQVAGQPVHAWSPSAEPDVRRLA
jgi:gamma-glutamylcyclotransferase (GGCT)/AIG2-like uncharacterized protein YtfP